MKKIGILFGMENTFPGALVERINSQELDGISAEFVRLGGVEMASPSGYAVIVDRISHDMPFYRAYLKNAVLTGTQIINNPFWWSADDKFFNYSLATKLGVAVPRTVLLSHKEFPPEINAQSVRNLEYPLDWDHIFHHVKFPASLKPHDGGGWRDVTTSTPAKNSLPRPQHLPDPGSHLPWPSPSGVSFCTRSSLPTGAPMSDLILTINGTKTHVSAPAEETLLSVLRYRLNLTGTKYGCGEGECGACTVLLDGKSARACQTAVAEAANARITTIEGLEQNGRLSPVQQAFLDAGAFQCGFCTSGMIVRATALLHDLPNPSEKEIVTRMNGNICRCGTYPRIVDAVQRASRSMAKAGPR